MSKQMNKHSLKRMEWETPSLEWIHEIRRKRWMERKGRPPRLLSPQEAKALATKFGLRLARKVKSS